VSTQIPSDPERETMGISSSVTESTGTPLQLAESHLSSQLIRPYADFLITARNWEDAFSSFRRNLF
jgi:hypothetical protein